MFLRVLIICFAVFECSAASAHKQRISPINLFSADSYDKCRIIHDHVANNPYARLLMALQTFSPQDMRLLQKESVEYLNVCIRQAEEDWQTFVLDLESYAAAQDMSESQVKEFFVENLRLDAKVLSEFYRTKKKIHGKMPRLFRRSKPNKSTKESLKRQAKQFVHTSPKELLDRAMLRNNQESLRKLVEYLFVMMQSHFVFNEFSELKVELSAKQITLLQKCEKLWGQRDSASIPDLKILANSLWMLSEQLKGLPKYRQRGESVPDLVTLSFPATHVYPLYAKDLVAAIKEFMLKHNLNIEEVWQVLKNNTMLMGADFTILVNLYDTNAEIQKKRKRPSTSLPPVDVDVLEKYVCYIEAQVYKNLCLKSWSDLEGEELSQRMKGHLAKIRLLKRQVCFESMFNEKETVLRSLCSCLLEAQDTLRQDHPQRLAAVCLQKAPWIGAKPGEDWSDFTMRGKVWDWPLIRSFFNAKLQNLKHDYAPFLQEALGAVQTQVVGTGADKWTYLMGCINEGKVDSLMYDAEVFRQSMSPSMQRHMVRRFRQKINEEVAKIVGILKECVDKYDLTGDQAWKLLYDAGHKYFLNGLDFPLSFNVDALWNRKVMCEKMASIFIDYMKKHRKTREEVWALLHRQLTHYPRIADYALNKQVNLYLSRGLAPHKLSWQAEYQHSLLRRAPHQLNWKKENQDAELLYRYWDYVWISTFRDLHMPMPNVLIGRKSTASEKLKSLWLTAQSINENREEVMKIEDLDKSNLTIKGELHAVRAKLLPCEVTSKAISDLVVLRAQIEEEFPEIYENSDPLVYFWGETIPHSDGGKFSDNILPEDDMAREFIRSLRPSGTSAS